MKRLSLLLFIVLLAVVLAACGGDSAEAINPDDVRIAVVVEPDTLAVGDAMLVVTLQDKDGNAIDGATVRAHGDMDHEGMEPVDSETSESENGVYRLPFMWTMGGGWIVTITADLPGGGQAEQTFDFFVEAISEDSIINQTHNHDGMEATEEAHDHMDMEATEEAHDHMDMEATEEAHDHMDMEATEEAE
ncbi:MAG: hypothetical protein D6712_21625 [Chloroflexi bacterium]|nr:MAG: hypothetical protein D6712_21625 [Chloroflexota bacterium]